MARLTEIKRNYDGTAISKEALWDEKNGCLSRYAGEVLTKLADFEDRETPMRIDEIHCDEYYCPACHSQNNANEFVVTHKFCPNCGQRIYSSLNWEDWEDEKKDVCSAQSDIECMEAVVNISKMVEEIKDASYVIGEGEPDATEVIRTDRALKIIKEKLGI